MHKQRAVYFAGLLSMKMSTLSHQLRSVEDNLLTTQLSIARLEHLVAELAENNEDRLEAEHQLVHLRGVRSAFEEIRSGLAKASVRPLPRM